MYISERPVSRAIASVAESCWLTCDYYRFNGPRRVVFGAWIQGGIGWTLKTQRGRKDE